MKAMSCPTCGASRPVTDHQTMTIYCKVCDTTNPHAHRGKR
jgi:ribosomal protein S27E